MVQVGNIGSAIPRVLALAGEPPRDVPSARELMREASQLAEQATAQGRSPREFVDLGPIPERTLDAPKIPAPDIPEKFAGATFDGFVQKNKHLALAAEATKHFCRAVMRGEPCMLALIGDTGRGKSHLLYAAARALSARHQRVYARPWYRLADALRYGGCFRDGGQLMEPSVLREHLYLERVVLLDDIRLTAGTAFDDNELTKLALHGYDRNLCLLITTNASPLTDVMSTAAASRFTEVTLDGADWRKQAP